MTRIEYLQISAIFFALFILSFLFVEYAKIGKIDTGEEKCELCKKGDKEYACNCERIYENEKGNLIRYIPYIFSTFAIFFAMHSIFSD